WLESPAGGRGGPPEARLRCGDQATTADTGMTSTTPSRAELSEGYDRVGRRGEEQIGNGMLPGILEVRDRWYELEQAGGWHRKFFSGTCFKSSARKGPRALRGRPSAAPAAGPWPRPGDRNASRARRERRRAE